MNCPVNTAGEDFQRVVFRFQLMCAFYDMPRCVGRMRGIEIFLIIVKTGVIVLILPFIMLAYAPGGILL